MNSRVRDAVAPLFLFLSLILGGSGQGFWANMILELLGLGILVWSALDGASDPLEGPARQLLFLAVLALIVIALQLIPLPATAWPHLGGREGFATDYRVLDLAVPSLPLSLTPYRSLDALLKIIPPLAIFCAIVRLRAYRFTWLATALLTGTAACIPFEGLQLLSSDHLSSWWSLYAETRFGVLADLHHLPILLVIAFPFLAAVLACERGTSRRKYAVTSAVVGGAALLVLLGIALSGSLVAYLLALPVLLASGLLVLRQNSRARQPVLVISIVLLVAGVAFSLTEPIRETDARHSAVSSEENRGVILKTTASAARDFLPFGSGLGSFPNVYRLYESPDEFTNEYLTHANNDYLELALELGIPGIFLMTAFLAWWGRAAWRSWRFAGAGLSAQAASIASAAILGDGIVDSPLATVAASTAFLLCLALVIERRSPLGRSELWPTRHVVLT